MINGKVEINEMLLHILMHGVCFVERGAWSVERGAWSVGAKRRGHASIHDGRGPEAAAFDAKFLRCSNNHDNNNAISPFL
jgi:hypothetical protein